MPKRHNKTSRCTLMIERVTNATLLFIFCRVCVPLSCEVRLVLPIWDGVERVQITGLWVGTVAIHDLFSSIFGKTTVEYNLDHFLLSIFQVSF